MALVSSGTGSLLPLDPNLNRTPLCFIKENNTLYTGGMHTAISGRVHAFLNAINLQYTPGLMEQELQAGSRIYPNPASHTVTLSLSSAQDDAEWSLSDLSGKLLMSGVITSTLTEVNIEHLPNGVYFVRVSGSFGSMHHKLLVTR